MLSDSQDKELKPDPKEELSIVIGSEFSDSSKPRLMGYTFSIVGDKERRWKFANVTRVASSNSRIYGYLQGENQLNFKLYNGKTIYREELKYFQLDDIAPLLSTFIQHNLFTKEEMNKIEKSYPDLMSKVEALGDAAPAKLTLD